MESIQLKQCFISKKSQGWFLKDTTLFYYLGSKKYRGKIHFIFRISNTVCDCFKRDQEIHLFGH